MSLSKRNLMNEFLSLRCSGDVLNAVNPIGSKAEKEISEAMSIIRHLKSIVLDFPMQYNLVDLCSGNALVPVIAAHLLPITSATAVDKRTRNRRWDIVKNFEYKVIDIYTNEVFSLVNSNTIITGCHACGNLSHRISEIFLNTEAKALVLMPCCSGQLRNKYGPFLSKKLSKYELWSLELTEAVNGVLYREELCLSPKNLVIKAVR